MYKNGNYKCLGNENHAQFYYQKNYNLSYHSEINANRISVYSLPFPEYFLHKFSCIYINIYFVTLWWDVFMSLVCSHVTLLAVQLLDGYPTIYFRSFRALWCTVPWGICIVFFHFDCILHSVLNLYLHCLLHMKHHYMVKLLYNKAGQSWLIPCYWASVSTFFC